MKRVAPGRAGRNPFPGLRPFCFGEEHLFFGREKQVDRMIDKLAGQRFLAVVGTSGSGKSSLVNCGLRPALHRGNMANAGTSWRMAQFRPGSGSDPIDALARALAAPGVLFDSWDDDGLTAQELVETTLRSGSLGLVNVAMQARLPKGMQLLVVVDQFEELFRFRARAPGAAKAAYGPGQDAIAFVKLLLEARAQSKIPIHVVLTMRSDFLGDCAQFLGLAEAINESQYLVPRLTRAEVRAAITGPVGVGEAAITPVLVTRLLNDVGDNPDQLSILQHALNRTWAYWENQCGAQGPLDLPHYEAVGGMADALNRHADQALAELGGGARARLAERVFKALTDKSTDSRGIRHPTRLKDLGAICQAAQTELEAVFAVFRKPSRSFLMPPMGEELTGDSWIDISHESLMRVWTRLDTWADAEAISARQYRRLADAAAEHAAGRASLWRDPELQQALVWRDKMQPNEAWASRYHAGFAAAMEFLTQSSDAREAERVELQRQRQRDREREEEKQKAAAQEIHNRRVRWAAACIGGLAVIAMVFGVTALRQEQHAETQTKKAQVAESRHLAGLARAQLAAGDSGTALALAIESLPDKTAESMRPYVPAGEVALDGTRRHLRERTIIAGHTEFVFTAAFSPDGKRIVTASRDKTARLWDAATGKPVGEPLRGHARDVNSAAFSPDGQRIVTASDDKTARLWDAATGKPIGEPLTGHAGGVNSAEFSPDGSRIVTASADKTARLWIVETGKPFGEPLTGHADGVNSAAFSPDGKRIITASADKTARQWDAATGEPIGAPLSGHEKAVNGAAFSPDGKRIVTASEDMTARLWDAATGELIGEPLTGHQKSVIGVAFSADGRHIITASEDMTARLWDAETHKQIGKPLAGHEGTVFSAAFSPDGKRIVTAAADKTARLWDGEPSTPIDELRGHQEGLFSAAFSPDGKRIVTASADNTARVWDADTGREIGEAFRGHDDNDVNGAAFSPDGKHIVTASDDKTARLWDAKTGRPVATLVGHEAPVQSVAFSRDGTRIVSGSDDKTARLWDAETGKHIRTFLGHEGTVKSVTFSHDDSRIVTASFDGSARLWDVKTGALIAKLSGHQDRVYSAAFNPDGTLIATASGDKTAWLWDAATGKPIGKPLRGHGDVVYGVAFSPDGKRVVTASADKTARLWDAKTHEQIGDPLLGYEGGVLVGHQGGVMTAVFSPDGERIVTASSDKTARLWDAKTGKPIGRKSDTQEFLAQEKAEAPRCLSRAKRDEFFLNPEPPAWCIDMEKWPYHTRAWKDWLAGIRAGRTPPLPLSE